MAMKPKTFDELYNHKGDVIQVDSYTSIWNRLCKKKITGTLIFRGDKAMWIGYKTVPILVHNNDEKEPNIRMDLIKEGYSIKDIVDERLEQAKGPLEKKVIKEECKNLVPLEKITIVKCYHSHKINAKVYKE